MSLHALRRLSVGLVAGGLLALPVAPASAVEPSDDPSEPVLVSPVELPQIVGVPRVRGPVRADAGTWIPQDVELSYQWHLDMVPVEGADGPRFTPRRADVGRELVLAVTATYPEAAPVTALSEPKLVRKGLLENTRRPRVTGTARHDHTLTATPGEWTRKPDRIRYEWFRDGNRVPGATGRRYHLDVADFGKRIQARVVVSKKGFREAAAVSRRTSEVGHRVPARHTVTYSVETRGAITTSLDTFRKQAQATFDDPRGWRGSGVAFRRVASGGAFTLVLSEASHVPSFSSGCSSQWSCRVGRYVVVNQTRWKNASPMWNERGRTVRDYRHMVVNHETGHWLGHGHRHCPTKGALAPVMMQQSKGLTACQPNPWPTTAERRTPRFG